MPRSWLSGYYWRGEGTEHLCVVPRQRGSKKVGKGTLGTAKLDLCQATSVVERWKCYCSLFQLCSWCKPLAVCCPGPPEAALLNKFS